VGQVASTEMIDIVWLAEMVRMVERKEFEVVMEG
jgi:hypothetical protein